MKKVLKYLLYLFIITLVCLIVYAFYVNKKGPDPCLCLSNYREGQATLGYFAKDLTKDFSKERRRKKLAFGRTCVEFHSKKAGGGGELYVNHIKKLCNNQKATQYEEEPEVWPIDDQQEKAKREQEIKKILEGIQNRNNVKTVPEDELLTDNIYEDETRYDTEQNIDEEIETETDFYIIAVSVTSDKNEASKMVAELKSQGYNSNFLWIPDYKSLSGAKFYSVYIGPFNDINECANEVEKYRKIKPDAYALLVSNSSEQRVEIRGPGKIRKQELIN